MKKVFGYIILILLIVNVFSSDTVFSYEVDPDNKRAVDNTKKDIYEITEEFYDLFKNDYQDGMQLAYNNKFWWPIGSAETTEDNGKVFAKGEPESIDVSSPYGDRAGGFHRGVDITANASYGQVNIIAAKSGTVVYPTDSDALTCPSGAHLGDSCGGGYGNYVIIEHSDGNYTLYAHLYENSITVRAGDTVQQGQVIGKMGSSGNSTGIHLHFEIRIGQNSPSATVDPLEYISSDDPRPEEVSGNSFPMLSTSLSKTEFKSRLIDYYSRGGVNSNFETTFIENADDIYDIAMSVGVNPELVVVTALGESSFSYHSDNNYWGIGAANGSGTENSYSTFQDGVRAYCELIYNYVNKGNAAAINNRAAQRQAAGCNPLAYGTPDTLSGTQSIYSWIGDYRWSPGCSSDGGCYYLNIIYGQNYCSTMPTCSAGCGSKDCPEDTRTNIYEQCDYTVWQVQKKVDYRLAIFGL